MRIVFFLEPVVFRKDPDAVAAHLVWVSYFQAYAERTGGELCLVANPSTCAVWIDRLGALPPHLSVCPVDGFAIVAEFGSSRARYSRAAIGSGEVARTLADALRAIRAAFRPDLVVLTSQNAIAGQAFAGVPQLFLEQSPLPRNGHPFRTAFDPAGSLVGSLLEHHACRIRTLPLSASALRDGRRLLAMLDGHADGSGHPAGQDPFGAFGRSDRFALLATQPEDAVSFEGSHGPVTIEDLLYRWGSSLPAGWVGVPTYHSGQALEPGLEAALAAACPRLRFLPNELGRASTETLIPHADGLVTVSSTSAMTALLSGKRVVVTGRSPLAAWCPNDPARLAEAVPLSEAERLSTLCFLTHRYTIGHEECRRPGRLDALISAVVGRDTEWFFDLSDWSGDRVALLFGDGPRGLSTDDASPGPDTSPPGSALAEALLRADIFETEWRAAVADRDRIDALLQLALVRQGVYEQEWRQAVADRDRLQAGRRAAGAETAVLADE